MSAATINFGHLWYEQMPGQELLVLATLGVPIFE